MKRQDWYFGKWHLIRRSYGEHPQYGFLYWSGTLDIWLRQTLWTIRRHAGN